MAGENLGKQKLINKKYYDKKINPIYLKKNDLVLLLNETPDTKFAMPYLGPFRVEKTLSDSVTI